MDRSTVRLRALDGLPLADPVVRDTVIATANGIAERTGITLGALETTDDSITVTIDADKLAGMGFLAELRRLTNAWYEKKFGGGPLWGRSREGEEEWHGGWE